jgi:hypothetical protein
MAPENLAPVVEHFWTEHSIKTKELIYVDDSFEEMGLYEKVLDEITTRSVSLSASREPLTLNKEPFFTIDAYDVPWPIVKVEAIDRIMFVLPKEKAMEL